MTFQLVLRKLKEINIKKRDRFVTSILQILLLRLTYLA